MTFLFISFSLMLFSNDIIKFCLLDLIYHFKLYEVATLTVTGGRSKTMKYPLTICCPCKLSPYQQTDTRNKLRYLMFICKLDSVPNTFTLFKRASRFQQCFGSHFQAPLFKALAYPETFYFYRQFLSLLARALLFREQFHRIAVQILLSSSSEHISFTFFASLSSTQDNV